MANYNLTQTGAEVQAILNRVAAGYIYMGTADLTTTPDTTNPNVCYLFKAVGTYTNFGNIQHASGIGIALWNGNAWSYQNVPSSAVVATDATVTENSTNPVQSGGVWNELHTHSEISTIELTPTTTQGYAYFLSNSNLSIVANSSSYYSPFGGDTSSPVGVDISQYVGGTITIKLTGTRGASSDRLTAITNATKSVLTSVKERAYTLGDDGRYYAELTIPTGAKYFYWSAAVALYSVEVSIGGEVDGITERLENCEQKLAIITPESYVTKVTEKSRNLYNINSAEDGFIQNATGVLYPSTTYVTSEFIPVQSGVAVTVSPRCRKFLAYDESQTPIVASYSDSGYSSAYTYTPTQNGYIRASFVKDDQSQIELGTSATSYEPYWVRDVIEEDVHISETMEEDIASILPYNALRGKKWVHCGDSFSDYTNKTYDSGVFVSKYKTFPRLIAKRNGITLEQDFMLSGRTLAYPSDGTFTNSLCCPTASYYYQNIPADADYITIMLGINDIQHINGSGTTPDGEDATGVITLGTIDSTDTSTYYGAWNAVLTWLRNNRPFAHIGIIVTNGLGTGATPKLWKDAQIAIAQKYGYPYIDLNGDQHTPTMNRFNNENVDSSLYTLLNTNFGVDAPSNTHPNWQAHEYESTFIEAWLKTL